MIARSNPAIRRDLVFVHIGKTGGTSVNRYVHAANQERRRWRLVRHRHSTAAQVRDLIGPDRWERALKISIVRNPFERYKSACRQVGVDPNESRVWDSVRAGTVYRDKIAKHPRHIFGTQKNSLFIDGELAVDHVFRFEDGFEDLVAFLTEHGLESTFGHANKTQRPIVGLTKEARQFVRDYYAEDFSTFNYDKR